MSVKVRSVHKENSKNWWDEKYQQSTGFLYSKQPSSFLMSVIDLIPRGAQILDLACGEGRNAVALALKGFKVKALDFSALALERAQQLSKESGSQVEFKNQDLDLFLPELMSADVILAIDYKPSKILFGGFSRALKQNGLLIIEAPLMQAAKNSESVEAFECFQPNELLKLYLASGASFRLLSYSELDSERVVLLAQKTQLL